MTYTPDFTIKTEGGDIPLLFNSWTFREYSRKKSIELEELLYRVRTGQAFKSADVPDLLLIAAQSFCKFNNKPFNYTDDEACTWVDILGGFNSLRLVEVYKAFVAKLLNISPEAFEVAWQKVTGTTTEGEEVAEKKSLTETA
jgi:hypothetical protein